MFLEKCIDVIELNTQAVPMKQIKNLGKKVKVVFIFDGGVNRKFYHRAPCNLLVSC